jgi:hypothetical protein
LLREMIGFAAEKLMELEVGAKTGAAYGEKNALRLASLFGALKSSPSSVPPCRHLMSFAGSCFSTGSAPRPSLHGISNE